MDTNPPEPRDYVGLDDQFDLRDLDPTHDAEDLVSLAVHQFIQRNKFEACSDALQDVTPRQWRAQLNQAAYELENSLTDALEQVEMGLHDGLYSSAIRK